MRQVCFRTDKRLTKQPGSSVGERFWVQLHGSYPNLVATSGARPAEVDFTMQESQGFASRPSLVPAVIAIADDESEADYC